MPLNVQQTCNTHTHTHTRVQRQQRTGSTVQRSIFVERDFIGNK